MKREKRYPLSGRLWWHVFRLTGKLHMPGLAALLFLKALVPWKAPAKRKDIARLLIMSKDSFMEDALISFGHDDRFEVYSLDVVRNKALKAMASVFLPGEIGDNNYVSEKASIVKGKEAYRAFLKEFWLRLRRHMQFDAVLTANFAYYAERELAAVLEDSGTPFIVLHKENLKTPGLIGFYKDLYMKRRGPFLGRKIVVYNEIEKKIQIKSGVITPKRVVVTGMPRLDRLHEWRKGQSRQVLDSSVSRKQVLFFSFGPKSGLPIITRRAVSGIPGGYEKLGPSLDALNWGRLALETHRALLRLARDTPELKVVMKAKGRTKETSDLFEMIGGTDDLPSNVEIVVGGDPFDLITGSNVICGFVTTALFEALAAGKPIIIPWFAEALDENMQPYIVDLEDAAEYAKSPEDLIVRLRDHALKQTPPDADLPLQKKRILEKWVGNADGYSGQRVRKELLVELSRPDKSSLVEENE